MRRLTVLVALAALGCARTPVAVPDPSCGQKTTDWCPAPAGDPCGRHPDVASCRADTRCGGLPVRRTRLRHQLPDRGMRVPALGLFLVSSSRRLVAWEETFARHCEALH